MEPATVAYVDHDSAAPTGVVHVGGGRQRRPSAPLETGERYVIGPPLGRGGMGEVLSAHDDHIGRDIAIKRLHADRCDPVSQARFLREARIQGRLDHPAIPPVYELDQDTQGRPFFAMKKLSGLTLSEILRDPELRPRFSRRQLLRAFVDVCLAIELAHTRGIIHRDIKPSNILLGDFGEVYVLDWGVARMVDDAEPAAIDDTVVDLTACGHVIGTPGYMSPEQVLGRPDVDGRSDVFALGCVLYEILTGRPLHPRGDAGMQSVLRASDARPSMIVDDAPPELDDLCLRATAVSRDARLGSARELGEQVRRFIDGDRDFSVRGRIASDHIARAHAALTSGDDEHARRIALREAGRALALDPSRLDAAELIGQLVSTLPASTPRAVEIELAALDAEEARRYARVSAYIHAGYLGMALVLLLFYARDPVYILLLASVACSSTALCFFTCRRPHRTLDLAIIVLNIATIALFARMFTPFLVAPGVGVVTLMRLAFHPSAHRKLVVRATIASVAAILGVWFAELAGLLSPTMTIQHRMIVLHLPITGLDALPHAPSLCFYVIALFGVAAMLSHGSARDQRVTRHRSHVQAWQLRQLLSR